MNLESWLDFRLEKLRRQSLFREIPVRDEKPPLQFCSNDYLGLREHPALKQAAIAAVEQYGTGSGASRLLSGTFAVHRKLEAETASWMKKESALLFNSGYQAGIGMISAAAENGVIFSDELNHACLIDGCRLSRAEVCVYRHGDFDHLEFLLKTRSRGFPRWIVSESVFGMEGEAADLPALVRLKGKYGVCLFLDEAHAIGVYGKRGCGLAEETGLPEDVDLILGTYSKACGSFGGFAAGSEKLMAYLRNTARSFIFTTALPPAVAAVNVEAVRLAAAMEKERLDLREAAREIRFDLAGMGFEVRGKDSPIIPVIAGSAQRAVELSEHLLQKGIWIQPVRPPTVPPETSRLRITLSVSHTSEDRGKLLSAFQQLSAPTLNREAAAI